MLPLKAQLKVKLAIFCTYSLIVETMTIDITIYTSFQSQAERLTPADVDC